VRLAHSETMLRRILLGTVGLLVLVLVLVVVVLIRWGGGRAHVGRERRTAGAKILVVYYSRSGTTAKVAEALATALGADVVPIVDTKDRGGVGGFVRSLQDTIGKRPAVIEPLSVDPSTYELVVVGTPVWGNAASTPVRAFFAQHRELKRVAFFITDGLSSHQVVFRDLEQLAGQKAVATLGLPQGDVLADRHLAALDEFVKALEGAQHTEPR
jgi:hypothetical protein